MGRIYFLIVEISWKKSNIKLFLMVLRTRWPGVTRYCMEIWVLGHTKLISCSLDFCSQKMERASEFFFFLPAKLCSLDFANQKDERAKHFFFNYKIVFFGFCEQKRRASEVFFIFLWCSLDFSAKKGERAKIFIFCPAKLGSWRFATWKTAEWTSIFVYLQNHFV